MVLTANEIFEIRAEAFRIMTGYLAPGKAVAPAAYAGEKYEDDRRKAFDIWSKEHGATTFAMIAAFERVMPDEESTDDSGPR